MDKTKIDYMYNWMKNFTSMPNWQMMLVANNERINVKNKLIRISEEIEQVYPDISGEIFRLKDHLFVGMGQVDALILGELIALMRFLHNVKVEETDFWTLIHPQIKRVSKALFDGGHYANAAEDAFIEINDRVKKIYAIIKPNTPIPDGDSAMTTVFSPNNPLIVFDDINTDTGKNVQKGYMQMFAGAISALRNPKAHANIKIDEDEARRRLIYASMLMYKLDEGVKLTHIAE